MNKKLSAAVLAVVVVLSLAACGQSEEAKKQEQVKKDRETVEKVYGPLSSSRLKE